MAARIAKEYHNLDCLPSSRHHANLTSVSVSVLFLLVPLLLLHDQVGLMTSQKTLTGHDDRGDHYVTESLPVQKGTEKCRLMVIGAAAIDITSKSYLPASGHQIFGTTVPGIINFSPGGVALNLSRTAFELGVEDVLMVTSIGGRNRHLSKMLKSQIVNVGLRTDGILEDESQSSRTAVVNMLMDQNGNLNQGVSDMECIQSLTPSKVCRIYHRPGDQYIFFLELHIFFLPLLQLSRAILERDPKIVCFDGNLSEQAIEGVLQVCQEGAKTGEQNR